MRKESVMQMLTRGILIKAPVDRVFDFLVDPNNLPQVWPNIVEVKNVKKSKINHGFNFNWVYKMSGLRFEGKCETVEYIQYELLVVRSNKAFESTTTWRFQSGGRDTHLMLKIDYEIPAILLNQMKEEIIIQENEHEADAMIQNVRTRLELETVYA
jgi:uncharacterized membrane protein